MVDGFTIRNGYTSGYGGGIHCNGSSPTIRNCIVADNTAAAGGGGIYIESSMATVTNCLLMGNESTNSSHGGGMYCGSSSDTTITNCTFAGNVAHDMGGGLEAFSSVVNLDNCIFWGNSALGGNQLAAGDSVLNVSYCDVEGGSADIYLLLSTLHWLSGNIETNPLFIDPAGDDYHLLTGSPCIDTGDPGGDYTGQTDFDGDPRVVNGRVDMGADEYVLKKGKID